MDMAVLVNMVWKNEVDFTVSNHVTQCRNFSTQAGQAGYKTKNKNYYKLI